MAVAGWLSPALLVLSAVLLGRSFYVLYVRKRGSRLSKAVTWVAAAVVVGFWAWRLLSPLAA